MTFFKEDIPEGLVHFGFMNESTEMYAGKGVEQTFSFLHLSLQEYLAAWHLAHSYSIEFQVAYLRMAVVQYGVGIYKCRLFSKRKEEGKKLFSLPSFTAPDTEVLQSFSGLDPRLKLQCLEIHQLNNVNSLKMT